MEVYWTDLGRALAGADREKIEEQVRCEMLANGMTDADDLTLKFGFHTIEFDEAREFFVTTHGPQSVLVDACERMEIEMQEGPFKGYTVCLPQGMTKDNDDPEV